MQLTNNDIKTMISMLNEKGSQYVIFIVQSYQKILQNMGIYNKNQINSIIDRLKQNDRMVVIMKYINIYGNNTEKEINTLYKKYIQFVNYGGAIKQNVTKKVELSDETKQKIINSLSKNLKEVYDVMVPLATTAITAVLVSKLQQQQQKEQPGQIFLKQKPGEYDNNYENDSLKSTMLPKSLSDTSVNELIDIPNVNNSTIYGGNITYTEEQYTMLSDVGHGSDIFTATDSPYYRK